jgi:hypothetical protein
LGLSASGTSSKNSAQRIRIGFGQPFLSLYFGSYPRVHFTWWRVEHARESLVRLSPKDTNIAGRLAVIEDAIEAERLLASVARGVSFFELFNKKNWRRTRIILYCNGISQMTGTTFLNNGPYFLVSAGLASTSVGMIVEIGISFAITSSIMPRFIMPHIGNRTLMLGGTGSTVFFFTLIGISGCFYTGAAKW